MINSRIFFVLLGFGVPKEAKHICLLVHLILSLLDPVVIRFNGCFSQSSQVLTHIRHIHQF
jgi:hypothetical protein